VYLRWKQQLGPVEIADRLGMPSSTVHAVLVCCRINRLSQIDRATGEPIRRYEHEKPGNLIHVDVKKCLNDNKQWRGLATRYDKLATTYRGGRRAPCHRNLATSIRSHALDVVGEC
jgi:hypothetical protein